MLLLKDKRIWLLLGLTLLLIGVALSLYLVQQSQENRSRASAASQLYFSPNSSTNAPIAAKPNDIVSLDVMLEPGENTISGVRLTINYDPQKFAPASGDQSFVVNLEKFPEIRTQPTISNGSIMVSVSTGSLPTDVIQAQAKVGTLKLRVLNNAPGGIGVINFGSGTVITSIDINSTASENVLSATKPATVEIEGPTPTITYTPTPTPTLTPTPTRTPTPTPTTKPGTPKLTCSPTTVKITPSGQTLQATLVDGNGKPLSGKTIVWTHSGSTVVLNPANGTTTTDAAGIAKITATVPVWDAPFQEIITAEVKDLTAVTSKVSCQISASAEILTPSPSNVSKTTLLITAFLHGIGSAGDNVKPTDSSGSNKNPKQKERDYTLELFPLDEAKAQKDRDLNCAQKITCINGQQYPTSCGARNGDKPLGLCKNNTGGGGQIIISDPCEAFGKCSNNPNLKPIKLTGKMSYDVPTGTYKVKLDATNIPNGKYRAVLTIPGFLARETFDYFQMRKGTTITLPDFVLVNGDVNRDNKLTAPISKKDINILDYNLIASCYTVAPVPTRCSTDMAQKTDLDDDGDNDEFDLNLFLREISVQAGDQ